MADETLRYDIRVNAKAAIEQLREMAQAASNTEERVKAFSDFLIEKSRLWNVPVKELLNTFKQLNAEMAKSKKQTIFGNVGGQNIFNLSGQYLKAAQDAGIFKTTNDGVTESIRKTSGAMDKAEKSAKGWAHGIDVVKTALGTLTAVGIFSIITFISDSFNKATQAAKQLELAIYNLANAERLLSQQGTEITPEGLSEIVTEVQKLVPTFSRVDITNAVSGIALFTKDLGLSRKELEELSKSIAVLTVRNRAFGLSFEQVRSQVLTGILTGRAQGIRDLGVSVSETTVQAEALRLGLVKTKEEFDSLSGEMEANVKAQALVSIITKSTAGEIDTLNEYLETNDARIESNKAAWEDFLAVVGQGINNLLAIDITGFLEKLQSSIELGRVKKLFREGLSDLEETEGETADTFKDTVIDWKLYFGVELAQDEYDRLKEILSRLSPEEIQRLFPDPSAIKDRFARELIQSLVPQTDTATQALQNLQGGFDEIDTSKAQDELEDMLKDLEKLQERMAEAEEDFQTKLTRFDEDTFRERGDLVEDYNLNVTQTLRQFALRRQEIEGKYRQKELEDERRFQEQLRQLREKFLYNLEDALRERDARQVLRLIDQYNMEKQALINENALRKKAADKNLQQELEQLEREKAERLRVMAEEFQLRIQRFDEESAIKRSRMEQDHAIEMQRLQEQLDERMLLASQKMAEEYGINEQGAQAIYNLLKQYYGTDGALAQLTAQGYASMLGQANGFLSGVAQIIAQYQGMMASVANINPYTNQPRAPMTAPTYNPSSKQNPFPYHAGGYASGGQFVATKPTTALFGEKGAELVTITPLSQLGAMQNSSPIGSFEPMTGQQKIVLDMNLSPDLEARVVSKAMDGTASVVSKINRSKL